MGRQATGRAPTHEDVVDHAVWVYDETLEFDPRNPNDAHAKALRAAIEAALNMAHRGFIQGTRDDIIEKAVDLDTDEENDMNEDGVASLLWYAKLLDETLPPENRLDNYGGV
jgi:hypothetical protein